MQIKFYRLVKFRPCSPLVGLFPLVRNMDLLRFSDSVSLKVCILPASASCAADQVEAAGMTRAGYLSSLIINPRTERTKVHMWTRLKTPFCASMLCMVSLPTGGLAIIIVTPILRLILFPLMQKQIRSSYRMQQFSPRIQEIQESTLTTSSVRPRKCRRFMQIGFNPITGCLPLFLQMPIFVALFQVLQEMGSPYRRHDLFLL